MRETVLLIASLLTLLAGFAWAVLAAWSQRLGDRCAATAGLELLGAAAPDGYVGRRRRRARVGHADQYRPDAVAALRRRAAEYPPVRPRWEDPNRTTAEVRSYGPDGQEIRK